MTFEPEYKPHKPNCSLLTLPSSGLKSEWKGGSQSSAVSLDMGTDNWKPALWYSRAHTEPSWLLLYRQQILFCFQCAKGLYLERSSSIYSNIHFSYTCVTHIQAIGCTLRLPKPTENVPPPRHGQLLRGRVTHISLRGRSLLKRKGWGMHVQFLYLKLPVI